MKPVDTLAELPPLRDGPGSQLSSAIGELSARGPDAAELASLATRLSLLGLPMTPATAPGPTNVANPGGGGSKLAIVGGAAVSGVVLWLALRAPVAPGAPNEPRISTPAANSAAAANPATAAEAATTRPGRSGTRQAGSSANTTAPLADPAPTTTPEPESASLPTQPNVAEPELVVEPFAVPSSSTPSSPTPSGPTPSAASNRKPSATQSPTPAETKDRATHDASTPTELELLRSARLALKSSPAEALRLTEQHQTSYPAGKLTQERELIAISALVAQGRRTAALARGASFERSFPSSPYRKQINELLQ